MACITFYFTQKQFLTEEIFTMRHIQILTFLLLLRFLLISMTFLSINKQKIPELMERLRNKKKENLIVMEKFHNILDGF